jgi:hypothetical protein
VFVDEVYKKLDGNQQGWKVIDETYIQITAWGSLDREVPRRNLRRWSLLSWEKVYNLDSDDFVLCQRCMLLADNDAGPYHSRYIRGDSRIPAAICEEVHGLGFR